MMTIERAIEILDPRHREHYDSIEPVNEACRMAIQALKKQIPIKPILREHGYYDLYNCLVCVKCITDEEYGYSDNICQNCGQYIDLREVENVRSND